jgi:hypothetical protein
VILRRGQVVARHFQAQDWVLELVVSGFREGLPIYSIVETRGAGHQSFRGVDMVWQAAENMYRLRVEEMAKEARANVHAEREIKPVSQILADAMRFHRRNRS